MGTSKVSIIVSCYNYGRYLANCLDSILYQTYGDYEVIIIDDGSTDNTDEVIEPYLKNPQIKYFRQLNSGQTVTKNKGINYAKGEFIAFLDADDMWEESKLEKQIQLFSDKNLGAVYTGLKLIDGQGRKSDYIIKNKHSLPKSGNVTKYLFSDNFIPFSSSIVRRECFEKCGCFDESLKMGIDWDLWLRISVHYKFAYVNEPLLFYRRGHADQMSNNLEERQKCSDNIMNKFIEKHPDLLPKTVIRKAWAYTYNNRGNYFRNSEPGRSLEFYHRSIREWPFQFTAYKNIIKHTLLRF